MGEARYLSLSGILNQTTLMRAIACALGLRTANYSRKIQVAVEDTLARSKLMLVMDEAHFLLPQTTKISVRPWAIDWINTALVNQGVPVALIATPQLNIRLEEVEKQTLWKSGQFRRRLLRDHMFPRAYPNPPKLRLSRESSLQNFANEVLRH